MPPLGLGHCGCRNSTSGSALWVGGKTAPEQISKLVLRGQTPLSPTPQEGTPSTTLSHPVTVPAGVIDLPRLIPEMQDACGGAVLCGLPWQCEALPPPHPCPPAVGQHCAQAAGFPWGRFGAWCASRDTALGCIPHPPSCQQSRKRGLGAGWLCPRFREMLELGRWGKEVLG